MASTRMDESAELAAKSPTVAEASICVATDNSEERAGWTLLRTSAGKLEASENKDESAGTTVDKGCKFGDASDFDEDGRYE